MGGWCGIAAGVMDRWWVGGWAIQRGQQLLSGIPQKAPSLMTTHSEHWGLRNRYVKSTFRGLGVQSIVKPIPAF